MAKRLLVLVALLFILPATALAATVHVRVEGKTKTLFAPQEATVTAGSALDALQQASLAGEFYYHLTQSSFGKYVDQVGLYGGTGDSGWVFKVNDVSPPVGADQVQLQDGDHVLWYYATFGPTGGPPTLEVKAAAKGCYTRDRVRRRREGHSGDRSRRGTSARRSPFPARRRSRSVPARIPVCSCARRRPVPSARTR